MKEILSCMRIRLTGFEPDHGAERSSAFKFGWIPGVPIGDRMHGSVEVDFVDHLRDIFGVSPVPKERTLFDDHIER